METFVGGLALAGITGLTILAYRHHEGYRRISVWLKLAALLAVVGTTVWDVALLVVYSTIRPYIDPTRLAESWTAAQTRQMRWQWFLFISVGIWLYLALLDYLPHIVGKNDPKSGSS